MSEHENPYEDMDVDEDDLLIIEDDDVVDRVSQLYSIKVDESEVIQALAQVPDHPGMRSVLDRTIRLRQLLGDKDGQIADLSRDIESELFLLIMEIRKDPSQLILSSLSSRSYQDQIVQIDKIQSVLDSRLNSIHLTTRLNALENLEVNQ